MENIQQMQKQFEALQAENVRLKAEIYDVRTASQNSIANLEGVLAHIAREARVVQEADGSLKMDKVVGQVVGLIHLGLSVEGAKSAEAETEVPAQASKPASGTRKRGQAAKAAAE